MTDALGGKPVSWNPPADWEKRAGKIAAFLKARQPDVRGIGLAGDYALGTPWDAAVLTVVVFFPDWQPDYTLGALQSMEDMPAALDWVTTGYFVELDRIFDDDERAHRLATLQPLAMYDRVLRDVLTDFRDRYFSREERTARVDRLLALARAAAARCADGGEAVAGVEAFLRGYGPALCHLVDEPPSSRRMWGRFRDAARVKRLREAVAATRTALALDGRDLPEALAALGALRDHAEAEVHVHHAEALGGLEPYWRGEMAKGSKGAAALLAEGAAEAALVAVMASGMRIDALAVKAVPEFRRSARYAQVAAALYGAPDVEALRTAARLVRGVAEA